MIFQRFSNRRIRSLLVVIAMVATCLMSGCAGLRPSANMGLNVHFGPHGPTVDPYVNVGLSTGGGCCWRGY